MSRVRPEYDVVIVGSGPGGSTLAHGLARRGLEVLIVDRGDVLKPLPAFAGQVSVYMDDVEAAGARSTVGGSTKYYGAALYRLREHDFQATATENGESPAWPISYADLEPHYAEAERLYGVRGTSEGDPSEPPRSTPYPHGPIPHEPLVAGVVERIRAQGVPVACIPKGLDVGPGGRCVLCATCDAYYCQRDAKMDAETAALRPALQTGRVQLLTRTSCLKVLVSPDGRRATGVLLRHETGEEHVVHAGVVAVCAGVANSPLLLWRSRGGAHPHGIGNASGSLGRYLAGHTGSFIFPVHGWKKLPPLHQKTFAINAFYGPSGDWPYPLGVIQATGQIPVWRNVPAAARPFVKFVAERSLPCLLMTELVGSRDTGLEFGDERIVGRRSPRLHRETFLRLRRHAVDIFRRAGFPWVYAPRNPKGIWHAVGTARMGSDPATSVLDGECRVHGMDNLYVVDSSALPSAGAVNTTLTVNALSLRVAGVIARQRATPSTGREQVA